MAYIVTHNEFISVNPWFELAIVDSINRELYSERLKYKIRDQITAEFPNLFRQHCVDSDMWKALFQRLDARVTDGVEKVNHATARQVDALVANNAELTMIHNEVNQAFSRKYDTFENTLARQNEMFERERNQRLNEQEKKINNLQITQYVLFLGGVVLGGVVGFFLK